MKLRYFLAMACLALSACGGALDLGNVNSNSAGNEQPVSANSGVDSGGLGSATILDERLMFAAEAAYNVPAQAYVAANRRGQISPALKARIKPLLVSAYARLQDARRLYRLGNAADFTAAANEVIGLANSAKSLLPASALPAETPPPGS